MLKSKKLFHLVVVLCAAVCLGMFSYEIYALSDASLVLTGSFTFSRADGTLEILKYESQNSDQIVINGNYTSSQGQSFGFTSDSRNRTATFNLDGGTLHMQQKLAVFSWIDACFMAKSAELWQS